MLTISDDLEHNALIAEPSGALSREDFVALSARFDARVAQTGHPPNLVIHAEGFPGWSDFDALLRHLAFIRDHQSKVEKVALVSDARVLELAPRIARHFLTAQVRHFAAGDLAAALAWSAEPVAETGHVDVMRGLPDDVVGISVRGVITARDYAETIAPLIEAKLRDHPKLRFLYHVGPEFESFTAGAMWSDARVGLMHMAQFARIAVVSDIEWIRSGVRVFAPLIPGEVQVFAEDQLDAARAWVAAPLPSDA